MITNIFAENRRKTGRIPQQFSHLLSAVIGGFTLLLLSQLLLIQPPDLQASSYFTYNLVSGPDGGDPDPTPTSSPTSADLAVTILVTPNKPFYGQLITYTIVVTNQGPDKATWVQISDHLPTEVTYQGSSASQGTYSSTVGLWDVGTLPNQATATLLITAIVNTCPSDGSSLLNIVSRTRSEPLDPNPDDDTSETAITVICADLAITQTVHPDVGLTANSLLTYVLTVTNQGPFTATGVTISSTLPDVIKFRRPILSKRHIFSGNSWLLLDGLPSNQSAVLTITGRVNCAVDSDAPTLSHAEVKGIEPDLFLGNNRYIATVEIIEAEKCVTYLPMVFKNFAPCQLYTFDIRTDQWEDYEDEFIKSGYLNDEFQIVSKNPRKTHIAGVKDKFTNYHLKVKARWFDTSSMGSKYGITFGITQDLSSFYTFMVYPITQQYEINYYNGAWQTLYQGYSAAISPGLAVNHLWLERLNGTVSISVNNISIAKNLVATQILDKRVVGVGVGPYTQLDSRNVADARFDDYELCPISVQTQTLNHRQKQYELRQTTPLAGSVPGG